jgi:hypothetical protein
MPPSPQQPDLHPALEAALSAFTLIADEPVTDQQLLFSLLDDDGKRKPEPILYSPFLPESFKVDLTPLQSLTQHGHFGSLIQDDGRFYSRHRMTITEFLLLFSVLEPQLVLTRQSRQSVPHHSAHRHTKLTPALQLLLWFYYTKGAPIPLITEIFGNLHPTSLYRAVDHVTQCIQTALSDVIRWPTAEERMALHGWTAVCDTAIGYLDGTHCPIQHPIKQGKAYYSSYKHKYTQNYLVAVNPLAIIIYIAGPYPGRENDRGDYNSCSLATDNSEFFSEGEVLLADGGFIGGPGLLVPIHGDVISREEVTEEREDMLLSNDILSEGRVVVEDVFSWLKARARILERVFPRRRSVQAGVFTATCEVYNFIRLLRIKYAVVRRERG